MAVLNIAKDFSKYTGLRHCDISEKSGEEFYHSLLNQKFKEALDKNECLILELDGADGFAPSFLDEAIGNLVFDFSLKVVEKYLDIVSVYEPHWLEMIKTQTYPQWEDRRLNEKKPKTTEEHKAWYRLVNDSLELNKWS
jgi:hypothetical protein